MHEVIQYNFGVEQRHGIFRDIPVREVWTPDNRYERVYDVKVQKVTATGTSAATKIGRQGNFLHIRIGDPNQTVTGSHTYTIDYTVKGTPTGFPDHDELYWDAIGFQWPVPIDAATVHLTMPANITRVACYAGSDGTRLACDTAHKSGKTATFTQRNLGPEQGVTIAAAIPKGAITPPPAPKLDKKWNLSDAFTRRPDTMIPAGGLALVGIGGVGFLVWRKGRDRRYTGSAVDATLGNDSGEEQAMPPLGAKAGPVEFVPPEKIRPGELGVLIDEQANLLDVTASIVDLAVRGYLTITELEPEGLLRRRHDYELTRQNVDDAKVSQLTAYEKKILGGLFAGGVDTVKLSDLKYKFRAQLSKIQESLYDDAMKKGWFRTRPDKTRAVWHAIGIGVLIIGGVATFFAAKNSTFGLVPLAIVLLGLALLITANRMPAAQRKAAQCCRESADSGACSTKATKTFVHGSPRTTTSSPSTCRTRSCSAARRSGPRRSKDSTPTSSDRRRGTAGNPISTHSLSPTHSTTSARSRAARCTRASRRRRAAAGSAVVAGAAAEVAGAEAGDYGAVWPSRSLIFFASAIAVSRSGGVPTLCELTVISARPRCTAMRSM